MRTPPKNQRAAYLAAMHCTHPDLDTGDKSLLGYLAMSGNHGANYGGNCHPGNRNLADALKLTDRPVDNRLRKNIERGLIERTEAVRGRGRASVYRIRWESPYFPDHTPGGEPLTEETRCPDSAISQDKTRCLDSAINSENALRIRRKRAAKGRKTRCLGCLPIST